MRRIDRAREIHRRVLALDAEHGRWEQPDQRLPDTRVRVIDPGAGWQAWITTPFSARPVGDYAPCSYGMAVLLKQKLDAQLPNVLDLWVDGAAKVLSVEWDEDEMKIVSMKRGSWENALFDLPVARAPD